MCSLRCLWHSFLPSSCVCNVCLLFECLSMLDQRLLTSFISCRLANISIYSITGQHSRASSSCGGLLSWLLLLLSIRLFFWLHRVNRPRIEEYGQNVYVTFYSKNRNYFLAHLNDIHTYICIFLYASTRASMCV